LRIKQPRFGPRRKGRPQCHHHILQVRGSGWCHARLVHRSTVHHLHMEDGLRGLLRHSKVMYARPFRNLKLLVRRFPHHHHFVQQHQEHVSSVGSQGTSLHSVRKIARLLRVPMLPQTSRRTWCKSSRVDSTSPPCQLCQRAAQC
jgi:hypothetical protein